MRWKINRQKNLIYIYENYTDIRIWRYWYKFSGFKNIRDWKKKKIFDFENLHRSAEESISRILQFQYSLRYPQLKNEAVH